MPNPVAAALRPLTTLVELSLDVPLRLAGPLGRTLSQVDQLVAGLGAIHEQFVGLRQDIAKLDEGVQGLRSEVRAMAGAVAGINDATQRLDGRVVVLAHELEGVGTLATRLGRLGRRRADRGDPRAAAASAGPPPDQESVSGA